MNCPERPLTRIAARSWLVRADRPGQPQLDAQRVAFAGKPDRPRLAAGQDQAERLRDLVHGDAVQRGLLLVGEEDQLLHRCLDRVVDLDHAGLGGEPPATVAADAIRSSYEWSARP